LTRPLSSVLSCVVSAGAFFSVINPGAASAQEITVTGRVVERTQSSWIGGATVRLSGSPPFFTDLDGAFRFSRVIPGRHTLTVQALGYRTRSMELMIQSDTTITIELDPDPIVLDSLLVGSRSGTIRIRGEIFDAQTGDRVLYAQVTVQPDFSTFDALLGRFTAKKVPIGRAVTVLVEAIEYLPARIALITEADTSLTVEMEPDSVAIRLLAQKAQMLEARSLSLPVRQRVLDKEELARYAAWPAREAIVTHLGMSGTRAFRERMTKDPHCIFIDDRQQFHLAFLWGLGAGEIERVELYDRGRMVRVYTKRYVMGLGAKELPPLSYTRGGLMGPICR